MLEPISSDIAADIVALNNKHVMELSWLDEERLRRLLAQAFYAQRAGRVDAFLLALDERADYDSPNYLWFRARYRRFVYVDRIVVAQAARGRGLARLLYADLFTHAAASAHDLIACEVNAVPPNPASDRLHAELGFTVAGEASIHDGLKTVRYLTRTLA